MSGRQELFIADPLRCGHVLRQPDLLDLGDAGQRRERRTKHPNHRPKEEALAFPVDAGSLCPESSGRQSYNARTAARRCEFERNPATKRETNHMGLVDAAVNELVGHSGGQCPRVSLLGRQTFGSRAMAWKIESQHVEVPGQFRYQFVPVAVIAAKPVNEHKIVH